ncbi:MAG: tetratricopeptide repeat protein, partial [Pseudomonadota bacterium]|nr:tetratricopeptide repeat protein [Pseudomonadota bacterium]
MGEVYLCLDLELNVPVALKTFQRSYIDKPSLRESLDTEVEVWVALGKHLNIVRCLHLNIVDSLPFIFMEWVAGDRKLGTDLRSWLRQGALPPRRALDFALDICRGLSRAAQKKPGLVHRDLKPENILITDLRVAKITDFGLAKVFRAAVASGESVSETGAQPQPSAPPGPMFYMAPEQWRGEPLDVRADIYAIGCILYQMLAGSLPFAASTINELRRLHSEATVPKLPGGGNVPEALTRTLERCLAKDRGERFVTAEEMSGELSDIYRREFSEPPREFTLDDEFTAAEHMNRGNTYERLGRHEEALADFNTAARLASDDADVYSNRGSAYNMLRRYDEALADFARAIQLDPAFPHVYTNRGTTYDALNRREEALADYTRAIQVDDSYTEAYYNRGRTRGMLGLYEEAIADFTRAIELDPKLAVAYAGRGNAYGGLERYEEAIADYDRALKIDPILSPVYLDRGGKNFILGRYKEALSDFNKATYFDPNDYLAYYRRGLTRATLAEHETARGDFSRTIELNPRFAHAHTARAEANFAIGRYEEALTDFNYALELDPTDFTAHLDRGALYARFKRYDEARADFARTIELKPATVQAYMKMGALLSFLGAPHEALPYFEEAAKLGDPEAAQHVERTRQVLLAGAGVPDSFAALSTERSAGVSSRELAAGEMVEVGRQLPEPVATSARSGDLTAAEYVNQGVAYKAFGRLEEALAAYDRAVGLEPNFAPAYSNRGNVYKGASKNCDESLYCRGMLQGISLSRPILEQHQGSRSAFLRGSS